MIVSGSMLVKETKGPPAGQERRKRKVIKNLSDYTICKREFTPFLEKRQIVESQPQDFIILISPF